MKKYSGLILFCVILGLMGMVTLAWATAGVPAALTDFRLSHNVNVDYVHDSATLHQGYGVATKHIAGDRIFGTTDSSNIYYQQGEKGKDLNATSVSAPSAGLSDGNMTTTWHGTAL